MIADLNLKKVSSLRMFEINTSWIGKPPKLASEKYGKRKKRKFTYQERPSCGAKLNKLFEGATKTEPTEKEKKEECEFEIRFNFRNKNKKSQLQKSELKQGQGTKSHNCEICKLLINEVYLKCNLCDKYYHSVCAHPFSNAIEQIAGQAYVCTNCIHDKNSSFYYFLAREAFHAIVISENFIKEQYEVWQSLPPHNKIDIRYLKFPLQSHYRVLPKQEEMLVASKNGILNYFNNCYIPVVIQSLAGTVCQRFIPSTLESDSQHILVLNIFDNKLTTSIKDSRVNFSKEFAILSKRILDVDLRIKEHHDGFDFLEKFLDKLITENLFVDEHFTYRLFDIIKCLSCNFIAGEVIRHQKDIIMPIPEQETPLTLENLIYSKFSCGIHEQDERTRRNEGCSGKVYETLVLGAAPKVSIVYTARNTSSIGYCLTPVEVPYYLYLDQFVFEWCGSITYTLISLIYRCGSNLSTGHFNCILFTRDGTCCSFDDTNKTLILRRSSIT